MYYILITVNDKGHLEEHCLSDQKTAKAVFENCKAFGRPCLVVSDSVTHARFKSDGMANKNDI